MPSPGDKGLEQLLNALERSVDKLGIDSPMTNLILDDVVSIEGRRDAHDQRLRNRQVQEGLQDFEQPQAAGSEERL